ncbi:hypothetical protein PQR53_31750 [Paraburkholderia fungorum]|uniref:hypothetical protein n=1 Tax=Paraburkholderia fungorum TaxID=134537 RepID=UPI0038B7D75E
MKGIDAKKGNERSFDALVKLLRAIIATPEAYVNDSTLEQALGTQKGMAAYEDTGREISHSSLNTIRRLCARKYGDLTFEEFDLLRARARNALLSHKAALLVARETTDARVAEKLDSRDAMRLRIATLKRQKQAAVESAIHASGAFMEALRICRDLANSITDSERLKIWRKEEKELLMRFSLRRNYDGKENE